MHLLTMRFVSIFLFLFLTACGSKPDLVGHWHLVHNDPDNYEETFDYVNDSTFLFQHRLPFYGGWMGYLDEQKQTLYWGGECIMGDWSYSRSTNNEIQVFHRREPDKLIGTLVHRPDCTPMDDLFIDSRMEITLPIASDTLTRIGPPSLLSFILVGPVKSRYASLYPQPWSICLGSKIIDPTVVDNFWLFDEQHRVKLPEAKRDQIIQVVFMDAHTPVSALAPVIDHYCQMGQTEMYFAGISKVGDNQKLVYAKRQLNDLLQ